MVSRWLALAAGTLLFAVLATANSGGYRYGISDQAFYVPAVVRAGDSADLDIVLEIIKLIEEQSKGAQPRVEVVHLDHGDANYIATTLNSIFARVTLGQDGNYVPAQARKTST